MKKRILAILSAAALIVSLTACGGGGSSSAAEASGSDAGGGDGEKMTFAYSCATSDNEYFSQVADGMKEICDAKGIDFIFEGADYDAETQVKQFENYIAKGVNAIVACPVDDASLSDVVKEAQEAGIVVIGQAQAITGADGNSIVDDYEYGVNLGNAAAEWINAKFADEEKVEVCLLTLDHQAQVKLRGDGMEDTINALPNAEVVYRQKAESSEEGMSVVETALAAHPDIKVIACVNDQMAIGAWQAVEAAGIADENFYIGGGDYTNAVIPYLEDPECAIRVSVGIGPVESGKDCANMAYDILANGGEGKDLFFSFEPVWQEGAL